MGLASTSISSRSPPIQKKIAKLKEEYGTDDLMRVVFKDNGFKDAEVKTNAIQILKQFGIDDVKSL